ncbi:helix-turn-helix domain-containing protein [Paenibacillus sp. YYML68]|uniref:helix-turn-helix domain-containing protein n=1 Tax=Paenibacillus sp. YYML68 TaxID=2909250 RepID=UPI002493092F|nr:helix-turn-helix domain-containing protein [Paenibacillus sp. YYML68]
MHVQLPRRWIALSFLLPYLCVLLLSALIAWMMYRQTIETVQEEVMNRNRAILELAKQQLDRQLAQTYQLAVSLSNDPKVLAMQYVQEPYQSSQISRLLELEKQLKSYAVLTSSIQGYYVYYPGSRLVVTSDRHAILDTNGETLLPVSSTLDFIASMPDRYYFREVMTERVLRTNNGEQRLIPYVHSIGYPNHYLSHLVLMLDSTPMKQALSRIDLEGGGYVYVMNERGEVILAVTGQSDAEELTPADLAREQEQEGRQLLKTSIALENGSWKLVAIQPRHVVLSKVHDLRQLFSSILTVMLALGGIVSGMFAYRNSKPMKKLTQTVFQLELHNESLHRSIELQRPLLQAAFLQRLFDGSFTSQSSLDSLKQHVGIRLDGSLHRCAVVQIRYILDTMDESAWGRLDREKAGLRELLEGAAVATPYMLETAENELTVLYSLEGDQAAAWMEQLEETLQQVKEQFSERYANTLQIGLGRAYTSLLEVSASYQEAACAVTFAVTEDTSIMHYERLPRSPMTYYYPFELEQRLLNYVRSGSLDELKKTIELLYEENFRQRSLVFPVLRLFVCELMGTVMKQSEQEERQPAEEAGTLLLAPHLSPPGTLQEAESCFRQLTELLLEAGEQVNDRKRQRNQELIMEAVAYLDEHYGDSGLCLALLSGRFQISETYLSLLIKEYTGLPFSDYLNMRRMSAAKELLVHTSLGIEVIAGRVGFTSLNSFSRAFKRIHGVTPTSYRNAFA